MNAKADRLRAEKEAAAAAKAAAEKAAAAAARRVKLGLPVTATDKECDTLDALHAEEKRKADEEVRVAVEVEAARLKAIADAKAKAEENARLAAVSPLPNRSPAWKKEDASRP